MQDQLGALGLVLNAIVLFDTRYLGGGLRPLRDPGTVDVDEEDEPA